MPLSFHAVTLHAQHMYVRVAEICYQITLVIRQCYRMSMRSWNPILRLQDIFPGWWVIRSIVTMRLEHWRLACRLQNTYPVILSCGLARVFTGWYTWPLSCDLQGISLQPILNEIVTKMSLGRRIRVLFLCFIFGNRKRTLFIDPSSSQIHTESPLSRVYFDGAFSEQHA